MTTLIAFFLMLGAVGQTNGAEVSPDSGAARASTPTEGLWPSEKLLGLLLSRVADQMTERYGLSEERRKNVRDAFVDRWSKFLNNNRAELQPLANEFLEMRLELTPPKKERVQEWAGRTERIFDEIRQHVRDSREAVRESVDPKQRTKFAAESMAMEVGLQFAEMKLSQYKAGRFEDVDFWQPHGMDRDARKKIRDDRREKRKTLVAEIRKNQPPVDQIALELSSWEVFTADFVRIYDLDEGQRSAALSCLGELSERANSHRDRYRVEIGRLEKLISEGSISGEELDAVKENLVSLYGPIDAMFGELKNRLGRIPTTQQRERVSEVRGAGD